MQNNISSALPSCIVNQNLSPSFYLETLAISGFTYFNAARFTSVPPMRAAVFSFTMITIMRALTPYFNHYLQDSNSSSPLSIIRECSKISLSFLLAKAICNIFNQSLTNKQIIVVFGASFVIYQIALRLYKKIASRLQKNPQS
jgi:hypothetical protein